MEELNKVLDGENGERVPGIEKRDLNVVEKCCVDEAADIKQFSNGPDVPTDHSKRFELLTSSNMELDVRKVIRLSASVVLCSKCEAHECGRKVGLEGVVDRTEVYLAATGGDIASDVTTKSS